MRSLHRYCDNVEELVRELVNVFASSGKVTISVPEVVDVIVEVCGEDALPDLDKHRKWSQTVADILLRLYYEGKLFGGVGHGGTFGIRLN